MPDCFRILWLRTSLLKIIFTVCCFIYKWKASPALSKCVFVWLPSQINMCLKSNGYGKQSIWRVRLLFHLPQENRLAVFQDFFWDIFRVGCPSSCFLYVQNQNAHKSSIMETRCQKCAAVWGVHISGCYPPPREGPSKCIVVTTATAGLSGRQPLLEETAVFGAECFFFSSAAPPGTRRPFLPAVHLSAAAAAAADVSFFLCPNSSSLLSATGPSASPLYLSKPPRCGNTDRGSALPCKAR